MTVLQRDVAPNRARVRRVRPERRTSRPMRRTPPLGPPGGGPLVAIDDLAVSFDATPAPYGRFGVSWRSGPARSSGWWGVGLRQERHLAVDAGTAAHQPAAERLGRGDRARGRHGARARQGAARDPTPPPRRRVPGPDDVAEPDDARRPPDHRGRGFVQRGAAPARRGRRARAQAPAPGVPTSCPVASASG
jgi:hypothetical protein